MYGFAPELIGGKVYNDDGIGGAHMYMPRFNHTDGRKRDYIRGFGMPVLGHRRANRSLLGQEHSGIRRGLQKVRRSTRYPRCSGVAPVRRKHSEGRKSHHGQRLAARSVRRPDRAHRLHNRRKRAPHGERNVRHVRSKFCNGAKAEIVPFDRGQLDRTAARSTSTEHAAWARTRNVLP